MAEQKSNRESCPESRRHFIYAATVCRFIGAKNASSTKRLDQILDSQPSQKATQELDDMYSKILEYDLKELDEGEIMTFFDNFRHVVGPVILLVDSLSVNALSKVCDRKTEDVYDIMSSLRSLFEIPRSLDSPIRLFHLSFREYLLDKKRCSNHQFWINKQETHHDIFVRCLTLMLTDLKMDICDLRLPGTLVSDVEKSRVEECLPPSLQYACRYWVHHLERSGTHLGDNVQIYDFIRKHFLHRLEALALMGKISDGAVMLNTLESILTVSD